jgi:large subunit ribosomal protein L2
MMKKVVSCTNGIRHKFALKKNLLSKYNNIFKKLRLPYKSSGGRNNTGRITVRHKGSGCKKSIHLLAGDRPYAGITIKGMYDAKRNSHISFCFDFYRKKFFKIIKNSNGRAGNLVCSSLNYKIVHPGYRYKLNAFPLGAIVNSINTKNKMTFAKSAGTYCQIIDKRKTKTLLRMPSGKFMLISSQEFATSGIVGNRAARRVKLGKAGVSRLKGIRPSVRGNAMNPVDHPHGGRSNKGMCSVTPWGIPTRGKKTVLNKKILVGKKRNRK